MAVRGLAIDDIEVRNLLGIELSKATPTSLPADKPMPP